MKTDIFEFKINSDKKLLIARKFDNHIMVSDTNLINIAIEEFETAVCHIINAYIMKELSLHSEKQKQKRESFKEFYSMIKELDK